MQDGNKTPYIQFIATGGLTADLNSYLGKWIVLYFYPKDATPGCTVEGCDFRDNHQEFVKNNAIIFGVSRDKLTTHEKFKAKQNFPFELISDENEEICQLFNVIKLKNMYGKQVRGIERSTFLIDPNGIIRYSWRKVKVPGHVLDVLQKLKNHEQKTP